MILVCVCVFLISHNRAIRPCHPSYSIQIVCVYLLNCTTVQCLCALIEVYYIIARVFVFHIEPIGPQHYEWTDCVSDDLRLFGVTGDWRTAALDPGAWYKHGTRRGL